MKTKILILSSLLLVSGFVIAQQANPAIVALQTGNITKAVTILEQAYATNNTNQETALLYAYALNASKQEDLSKNVLSKIKGETYQAKIAQGVLMALNNAGDPSKLFTQAVKFVKKGERNLVNTLIGEAYLYSDKLPKEKAVDYFRAAYEASTKVPRTLINYGLAYEGIKSYGDASQQYEIASSVDKNNPIPFFLLAKINSSTKNNAMFLINTEKAIALDPNFGAAIRELGRYYFFKNDYQKSFELYNKYFEVEKTVVRDDSIKYLNLLFYNKKYADVISYSSGSITSDTNRLYVNRLVAYAHYESGNLEEAKKFMDQLFAKISQDKLLAGDYEYYGNIIAKLENEENAMQYYAKAAMMDPTKTELQEKMGDYYFKQKNYTEAANMYQTAFNIAPKNAQLAYKTGLSHYYAKNYGLADTAFATVTALKPDAGTGYFWRGKSVAKAEGMNLDSVEITNENYGAAKPHFEKYLSIVEAQTDNSKFAKDMVEAFDYLSYYYFVNSDFVQANTICDKSLLLNPNNEFAKKLLEEIKNFKKK